MTLFAPSITNYGYPHLLDRHLEEVLGHLGDNVDEVPLSLRLAATDIFVEKAQYHLTRRGIACYFFAFVFLCFTAMISISFVWIVFSTLAELDLIETHRELNGYTFTLILIQRLVVGSVFFAGIYLSASFARAFLHEGTILFSRRHSLRFGRLFVYLSDGKITSEELFEAFGWNIQPATAFTRIRPEMVTRGLVAQLSGAIEKAAKVASAARSQRE